MGFEVHLKPIFGQPKVEWAAAGGGSPPPRGFLFHVHATADSLKLRIHVTDFHSNTWEAVRSVSQLDDMVRDLPHLPPPPPRGFLFHVHATADSLKLRIHVTDFHSNTWEAVRSVSQLDDMRDMIGIGGSWSEFIEYVVASLKTEGVKLVFEGHSDSDNGAAKAKLVAQKSKGMPVIVISLTKLVGAAASEAIANLSLQLFQESKSIHESYVQEQQRCIELSKAISAEKERNASIQSQLEQFSKRQKLQRISSSDKVDVSGLLSNGLKNSPEKQAARDASSTTVVNRVVPAYRRAKVRGALLQDTEDEHK